MCCFKAIREHIISNPFPICVCVIKQWRVLGGLHGEGEEDGQDVCHEVREEEAEEGSQSGE